MFNPFSPVGGKSYAEGMNRYQASGDQNLIKAAVAAALAFLLLFGAAIPSYAEGEEAPAQEEAVAPAQEEEAPAESDGYVPPPEAFEGLGGWAVVDPTTGIVYGVIVGDWDEETWEEVKNTRTVDGYMGCPAPCALRFQTRATADGNVAGWHGTQTNIDADGNASQSNDGSVRFDERSGTFQINNQTGSGASSQQTLVPEKTSRDADGNGRSMDLHTGLVDIRTSKEVVSGNQPATGDSNRENQSATVSTYQENLADPTVDVNITLPGLGDGGTVLQYVFGTPGNTSLEPVDELGQVTTDLISILKGLGFTKTEKTVDEETGEESSSEVLDDSNPFVEAILNVTRGIADFLGSLFGLGERTP